MKSIIEYISNDMKSFKTSLNESLLDDFDTLSKNADKGIKQEIRQFIKDNFKGRCKISKKLNDDGKYVVDCSGDVEVKNKTITSLTNGMFVWGNVEGNFMCTYCESLTSLNGAPKYVGWDFYCYGCDSLTSLEGCPEHVGRDFSCSNCYLLTSLEGAPKEVNRCFVCIGCDSLKTLKGAPKEVGGYFDCKRCNSLKTLEGSPERVGGYFDCQYCASLTSLKGAPKEVDKDFKCAHCDSLKSYDVDSKIKGKFIKEW